MIQMIGIQILLFGFIFGTNGFDLQCPHPSQRTYRIHNVCNGNSSAYTCLYDTRKNSYIEFCANRKHNYIRAGLKFVISGTFRNVICSEGRYQPVRFWSNESSVCLNLKSDCNGFGETVYDNRSTIHDASCRCDYTRGYAFVSKTRNPCFCIPSEEDCSCYFKECPTNTTLSPDYDCTLKTFTTETFNCQHVIPGQKVGTETNEAVLFRDNRQDTDPMRSHKPVFAVLICGVVAGILVVGFLTHDSIVGCQLSKNVCSVKKDKVIGHRINRNIAMFKPLSSVEKSDGHSRTPLIVACIEGKTDLAKTLIMKGADINIADNDGNTPLYWSCDGGYIDLVNLLLKNGSEKDKQNNDRITPLMHACDKGYISIVKRLIEKGADIHITDKEGDTAIAWACNGGKIEIVNLLIRRGLDIHKPNIYGRTPLLWACEQRHLSVVRHLINRGADIYITDKQGDTLFSWSCYGGNIDIVNILIDKGCNIHKPNNYGKTPLMDACSIGHLSIVNRLLDKGANINITDKTGNTPFSWACFGGNIHIVHLLIDKGCNIHKSNNYGKTPLMDACDKGHLSIVNCLIEKGVNINITDMKYNTPFSWACAGGNIDIVKLLIAKHCDIHKPNIYGKTPLMEACDNGHLSIVNCLIQRDVDINNTDNEGNSIFTWSCFGGSIDIVNILIDKGCNINKPNIYGKTPLMKACDNGHLSIVKLLIERAVDVNIIDRDGNTALALAASNDYKDIVNFLTDNARGRHDDCDTVNITLHENKDEKLYERIELKKDDFPWINTSNEFKVMLSKGEYESFDNRVFLSGACNCGKSTLACILIGEEEPKTWKSTDGLRVYFGRNGINLQTKEMLPLKKGTGDNTVYSNILRGQPNILPKRNKEQHKRPLSRPRDNYGKITNARIEASNEKEYQNVDITETESIQPFTSAQPLEKRHIDQSVETNTQETPDVIPDISKLDLYEVQKEILEEVRNGRYVIKIAPSDLVDFGGQRSYDMTHQLFIQNRGSFIIMFDGRYDLKTPLPEYPQGDVTSESTIMHWINSILTYCPEGDNIMPMVLFAATHSDSCTTKEKADEKKEKFKQEIENLFLGHEQRKHMFLDRVFFIDSRNSNDPEIKALTDQLVTFAMQQSTWGQKRPMAWVPLELHIDSMRSHDINIITRTQLEKINKINEDLALTDGQLEDFLQNQHTLGKVMYYKQPGLDGFVIIQTPALVNIMRSFITDETFWPKDINLSRILQNLALTGNIKKSDLWQLWKQDSVKRDLPDDKLKAFVTKLLVHLDILIHLKDKRSAPGNEIFLVPCTIKTSPPLDFFVHKTSDSNTIVLSYSLSIPSIPSALAFKLIGAVSNNFSLKEENGKQCLYHKAAIFMADDDNEIRMCLEGNCINVNLINRNSLQIMSPDIAASVQECLTKALKSSIAFCCNSKGQQIGQKETSKKISIKVGVVCRNSLCLLDLDDASKGIKWRCAIHKQDHLKKYPMYWFFDRKQSNCHQMCPGLDATELGTVPSNKHLVRLASKFNFDQFRNYICLLGLDENEFYNIQRQYEANDVHGIMFLALVKWMKDCKVKLQNPLLKHLRDALIKLEINQHLLCQIFREDTSLNDIIGNCLQNPVDDDILTQLPKHIGNCIILLGVELGVSVEEIEAAIYNNPKDMYSQIADVIKTWKTTSKHPTVFALLKALQSAKSGGLLYLCEKYNISI